MATENDIQDGAEDTQDTDDTQDAPAERQESKEPTVTRDESDGTVKVEFTARRPRSQKKADRGNQHQEALDRARRFEEKTQELERKIAELSQRAQAPQQAQTQTDPYQSRLDEIRQNQELVLNALRGAPDEASALKLKERFDQLEQSKWQTMEERIARRVADTGQRQQRPGETEETMIRSEFPDVVNNERALRWAIGEYNRMVYQEGETWKPNMQTTREAMRRAGEKFQLGRQSAPAVSPSQQARYGAVPSQAGARAGGFDGRLTKEQQRMALAMYPRLPENQAFAKWAEMYAKAEKSETAA